MFRKSYSNLTRQGKYKRRKKIQVNQQYLFSNCNGMEDSAKDHSEASNISHSKETMTPNNDDDIPFDPHHDDGIPFDRHLDPLSDTDDNLNLDPDHDTDSDDDNTNFINKNKYENFKENLRDWAICYHINLVAITALLSILKTDDCLVELPKDARTLLETQKEVVTRLVEPGSYSHIGLLTGLRKLWKNVTEKVSEVQLLIGIDGLPLYKSSTYQFWPILGMVSNFKCIKSPVFPIGIYCGKEKPKSTNSYLSEFVTELKKLISEGFIWKGQTIPVVLKGFILDAPAKSFLLNIKGHGGYFSCTKCTQRGTYVTRRVTFPNSNATKRTHESFLLKTDEDYHNSPDPILLETIPGINFLSSFPLDYMHLVCLGVVRTLMYLWLKSKPTAKIFKLPAYMISSLSEKLIDLKNHMPSEFNRKPRSVEEIKRWKATEYRQFLLYVGPVILKNILIADYKPLYDHFLSLSIAIYILLSPKLSNI